MQVFEFFSTLVSVVTACVIGSAAGGFVYRAVLSKSIHANLLAALEVANQNIEFCDRENRRMHKHADQQREKLLKEIERLEEEISRLKGYDECD